MRTWCWAILSAGLALAGCDDDPASAPVDASPVVTDEGVADAGADAAEPDAAAPAGTMAHFDPDFDRADPAAFFAFPYPSDLRLDAQGRPDLAALPNPHDVALLRGIFATAGDRRGFPTVPVAWFTFDAPLGEQTIDVVHTGPDAALLLIDVDPDSPETGRRIPVIAQTILADDYVPENTLALAPRPGFVLRPETTYAFVVLRDLGDADGQPLGTPEALAALISGAGEGPLAALYAPLWAALSAQDVEPARVAAATVFTTGDVVADLYALTEQIRGEHTAPLQAIRRQPEDDTERYCVLRAEVLQPQFQAGEAPFDSEGLFVFDEAGHPIVQRTEAVPVAIAIPRGEMPAEGWPLTLYFHGSGGESLQFLNAGPETIDTPSAAGRGPAWVLADKQIASAGSAHPISPERVPGANDIAYLNFVNLAAFRDTFRQGIIEQRLYLDSLLDLRVPAEVMAGCDGLSTPTGEHHFDPESLLGQGQSMGGMYTNLVGAVEPRLKALVPTGAGGYWSYFILETSLVPNVRLLLKNLLRTGDGLSHLHPTLHAAQTAWEVSDPMVAMPRLSRDPLPGHPVRPVYEPIGRDDSYFPPALFDAMVLAYGHPQAGDVIWPETQDALALVGLDGIIDYPVSDNLGEGAGAWTGVVVQYEGDGIGDPHQIYRQLDEVKYQYGCFFETFLATGVATVPAPAPLGTPCPGLE